MIEKQHTCKNRILYYCFLPLTVFFWEMVIKATVFTEDGFSAAEVLLTLLFSVAYGFLFNLIASFFKRKTRKIIMGCTMVFTFVLFAVQRVYFTFSNSFLSIGTMTGAGAGVAQFWKIALHKILSSWWVVLIMLIPLVVYFLFISCLTPQNPGNKQSKIVLFAICTLSHITAVIFIAVSPYASAYWQQFNPLYEIRHFGVVTCLRLDAVNSVFDNMVYDVDVETVTSKVDIAPSSSSAVSSPPEKPKEYGYNNMPINFDALDKSDKTLTDMDNYFSALEGTKQNQYTGLFKGKNVIQITLEGFSYKVVEKYPELFPTLYKMMYGKAYTGDIKTKLKTDTAVSRADASVSASSATASKTAADVPSAPLSESNPKKTASAGFVFSNFYNSLWGGSTASGEYAHMTGNFYTDASCLKNSRQNYLPFCLGNQLKKQGYVTYAFHNNTYTYYGRNLSHPNMGYDYIAVGNGLKMEHENYWPNSDCEMAKASMPYYINSDKPFHAYYMSVSGHADYSWNDNRMSALHRSKVQYIEASEEVKAYIACQIEVELMLQEMERQLQLAGKLDDTVFILSEDHYPYALSKQSVSELYDLPSKGLYGNPDLYRNMLIIYCSDMDNAITVDKPCSAIDILPTVSNLLGLEYDSRLLMGQDILSTAPALVPLNFDSSAGYWNWITDFGFYRSSTDEFIPAKDMSVQQENLETYLSSINNILSAKEKYSLLLLDADYYAHVFR